MPPGRAQLCYLKHEGYIIFGQGGKSSQMEIMEKKAEKTKMKMLIVYGIVGDMDRTCFASTTYAQHLPNTVFDAEGYVKPQSCIVIVIRHVALDPSHYDVQGRFRIELSEEGTEGRDELSSQLPQILHVSLGQKLVAAYALGLLTVVFLWT
ncbi:Motile sperm domain-containing protein 3 [Camelus dromedarius]|uniref:Motile sperm domain-containing protein 3 n=1 Tax=Camelus dromedarius TaxID=9838 RepID=A0A5N4DY73_CAMDR|nr:Motile sperm domain-containing protein 3 [Camelus dromedarius]